MLADMGVAELSLIAAALLIGATGAFSPCGFSVVETLGPTGHTGGRRTTIAACLAFVPGAVVGGIATFGTLAALGELAHGAGPGRVPYAIAAAIALGAAALEARGTRIVPQIRRQLPEHWRRVMPMPIAGGLYGVLLGMGFTTFVLSFGVWALAGIAFALGEPQLGLLVGTGFGIGRAIPVVALAPLAGSAAGARATEMMAASPRAYVGIRRGDAAALALSALALTVTAGSAGAAPVAAPAADPSESAGVLVFERLGGRGAIAWGTQERPLPGGDPAIGGPYVAVTEGATIRLLDRRSRAPVGVRIAAPGADAIAVTGRWLAYRTRSGDTDRLFFRDISNPNAPTPPTPIDHAGGANQLSPPSLNGGSILVYAKARRKGSRIVKVRLPSTKKRAVLRSKKPKRPQLFNPSVFRKRLAYVRSLGKSSEVRVRSLGGKGIGRKVMRRKRSKGVLHTTALNGSHVFITVLRPSAGSAGAWIVRKPIKKKRKRR